mmetsp:Transcript_19007/g.37509  ORF Transcript_19007/g.37509 Transcript_19007/m.37509 type:complete len:227 (+) Transcript_19007:1766-2446(+)
MVSLLLYLAVGQVKLLLHLVGRLLFLSKQPITFGGLLFTFCPLRLQQPLCLLHASRQVVFCVGLLCQLKPQLGSQLSIVLYFLLQLKVVRCNFVFHVTLDLVFGNLLLLQLSKKLILLFPLTQQVQLNLLHLFLHLSSHRSHIFPSFVLEIFFHGLLLFLTVLQLLLQLLDMALDPFFLSLPAFILLFQLLRKLIFLCVLSFQRHLHRSHPLDLLLLLVRTLLLVL